MRIPDFKGIAKLYTYCSGVGAGGMVRAWAKLCTCIMGNVLLIIPGGHCKS